jgi:cbb3-type cytochrome oxidase maturation protein
MNILYLILPLALLLGFGFLAAFLRSSAIGQYDDLETPRHTMLLDSKPMSQLKLNQSERNKNV